MSTFKHSHFLDSSLPDMRAEDLRVGDILLSRGMCEADHRGPCISDLIVKLDGGDYSHSAFFDGENFVQASTEGVVASPPTILPDRQAYMHVYRFHNADGKPLGEEGLPTQGLVNYIRSMIGTPYGYSELVLLGILLIVRRYPGRRTIMEILEVLGGIALAKLREWIEQIIGERAKMIVCSELVSETFWQPSDNKGTPYGLPIEITHRHRIKVDQPSADEEQEYKALLSELEQVFEQALPGSVAMLKAHKLESEAMLSGGEKSKILIAGSAMLPSMCVSPCDLQFSPALTLVGNYVQS